VALISLGIDHEHASLDLVELVTVPEHEWSKVLRTLISQRNIHEAVFVSTCLRTEVVAVIDRFHGAIDEITETLAEATHVPAAQFQEKLTVHFDRGVATHLFSVAAGLRSVVPGEFEILGQLRRALELAQEEHTAGAELTELFQRALASGRRVRAETNISRGTTSFAHEELGADVRDADVVVVGAGQLASGVVKNLLSSSTYLRKVTIANRSEERAASLRADVDDPRLHVARFEELVDELRSSRLAIVAVEVPSPIITRDDVAALAHPLLIVDLGVPRAVESGVDDVTHVRRIDIGDLQRRVERAIDLRHEAADDAQGIVDADVEKYLSDQRARGAAVIVSELREYFDEIVDGELLRRESELGELSDGQRERVRSLIRSVVAKIAHRPTVALKEAAGTDQGIRLNEATRSLFDL
jgi:glutamyl-tRNA reductase